MAKKCGEAEQVAATNKNLNEQLNSKMAHYEQNIVQLQKENDKLSEQLNEYTEQEQQYQTKAQEAQIEIAQLKEKYESISNILLSNQLSYKQPKPTDIEDIIKKLVNSSTQIKQQLDNLISEKETLKREKAESERHLKEANALLSNKEKEDLIVKERSKYLENEVRALKQEIEQGEREKCLLKKQNVRLENEFSNNKMKSLQLFSSNDEEKDKLKDQLEYAQKIADDNANLTDKLDEKLKQVTQQKNQIEELVKTIISELNNEFQIKVQPKLNEQMKKIVDSLMYAHGSTVSDDMKIMEERIRQKLDELRDKMSTIHSNIQSRSFRESKQIDMKELSASFQN